MDLVAALAEIEALKTSTAELNSRLEAVSKNNEALVAEKRSVSEQKAKFEEDAKTAAKELAKKNNDYDGLIKAHEDEKNAALEKLTNYERRIAEKEITSFASKIANEMAFDSDAAQAMQELITKRLQFAEDTVKIMSIKDPSVALSIDDFKKEILADGRFKYLVKQNQASGGRPINATASGRSNTPSDVKIPAVEKLNRARGIK